MNTHKVHEYFSNSGQRIACRRSRPRRRPPTRRGCPLRPPRPRAPRPRLHRPSPPSPPGGGSRRRSPVAAVRAPWCRPGIHLAWIAKQKHASHVYDQKVLCVLLRFLFRIYFIAPRSCEAHEVRVWCRRRRRCAGGSSSRRLVAHLYPSASMKFGQAVWWPKGPGDSSERNYRILPIHIVCLHHVCMRLDHMPGNFLSQPACQPTPFPQPAAPSCAAAGRGGSSRSKLFAALQSGAGPKFFFEKMAKNGLFWSFLGG